MTNSRFSATPRTTKRTKYTDGLRTEDNDDDNDDDNDSDNEDDDDDDGGGPRRVKGDGIILVDDDSNIFNEVQRSAEVTEALVRGCKRHGQDYFSRNNPQDKPARRRGRVRHHFDDKDGTNRSQAGRRSKSVVGMSQASYKGHHQLKRRIVLVARLKGRAATRRRPRRAS